MPAPVFPHDLTRDILNGIFGRSEEEEATSPLLLAVPRERLATSRGHLNTGGGSYTISFLVSGGYEFIGQEITSQTALRPSAFYL